MAHDKLKQESARMEVMRLLAEKDTRYLEELPASIPADRVLVHNTAKPQAKIGMNGFRAWLQLPEDTLEPCGCSWAPQLGVHHRVARPFGRADYWSKDWGKKP